MAGTSDVQRHHAQRRDAAVHELLADARGHRRRARMVRHPLPVRRHGGRQDRTQGRPLGQPARVPLIRTRALAPYSARARPGSPRFRRPRAPMLKRARGASPKRPAQNTSTTAGPDTVTLELAGIVGDIGLETPLPSMPNRTPSPRPRHARPRPRRANKAHDKVAKNRPRPQSNRLTARERSIRAKRRRHRITTRAEDAPAPTPILTPEFACLRASRSSTNDAPWTTTRRLPRAIGAHRAPASVEGSSRAAAIAFHGGCCTNARRRVLAVGTPNGLTEQIAGPSFEPAAASISGPQPFRALAGLRPERRLPADSWLPGHMPAQEARCAAAGTRSCRRRSRR